MESTAVTAPAAKGPGKLKIGLLAGAVGLTFGAGYYLRPPSTGGPAPVPSPAAGELTADDILKAMPAARGDAPVDKAMAALLQKARAHPDKPEVWLELGGMLAQAQRDTASPKYYDHAEMAYQRALKLKPASADALTGMAWVTGGRHLFDQSTAWANKALTIDEGNAAARGILGDAALELGDYDAAFDQYQKMVDLKPDLSSWSRGAHLLWLTGNKSKATWLMEKAIRAGAPFAENTAWCRAKLAMMFFHDGAFLPAARILEPALAANTRNTHILMAAGRIAAAEREYETASGYFQKVLETGSNLEALTALGDIHTIKGEMEDAEKFYIKVQDLHTANVASGVHDHAAMAKFYADHDRNPVEALRLAEQHKFTRNVLEADTLAWVYFKTGDLPKAIDAIKRALKQKTPDAEIHYHAGMIAAAFGDRVSAQKHLQEALNINPGFNLLQAPIAVKKLEELGGSAPTRVAVSPPPRAASSK